MSSGKHGASARFNWRFSALASLLVLPLAGCMTQGSSSFVDSMDIREQNAAALQEPLPLDVADAAIRPDPASGVADLTGSTQPASSLPGVAESVTLPQAAPGENEQMIASSLVAEQARDIAALAPEPSPAPAEAVFASVAPVAAAISPQLQSDPTLMTPEIAVDPLELAAEERAAALYAGMRHGQCEGGWGPKPKMINARRIDPSHKFYMEMRLRHTPPLPVGHVYIAYGRIGPNGEPLDEKLVMLAPVGGYAGATIAAAAPMPGVLEPYGDDCVLNPIAAYRLSLTAAQYEKLLLRIQQAQREKPRYALWTYNCNHFMSDIAASVGILPPENKYTPSLEYFYAMMDRNEGRKVARSSQNDTIQLASGGMR